VVKRWLCRHGFHRWNSVDEATWVGSIAYPRFLHTCRRPWLRRHLSPDVRAMRAAALLWFVAALFVVIWLDP
jgi:hypothetical protein